MEVWKEIIGYEGIYEVSNLGRIKSVARVVPHRYSKILTIPERIRKTYINANGYEYTTLSKNGKIKVVTIHCTVAIAFLGYTLGNRKIVVDHIDNNRLNNNLSNLQIISIRENCSKDNINETGFTGVYKSLNNFRARIIIDSKRVNLGSFKTKEEANDAYQKAKALL